MAHSRESSFMCAIFWLPFGHKRMHLYQEMQSPQVCARLLVFCRIMLSYHMFNILLFVLFRYELQMAPSPPCHCFCPSLEGDGVIPSPQEKDVWSELSLFVGQQSPTAYDRLTCTIEAHAMPHIRSVVSSKGWLWCFSLEDCDTWLTWQCGALTWVLTCIFLNRSEGFFP